MVQQNEPFIIIQGGKATLPVILRDKSFPNRPINLVGVTEITACFHKSDDTQLTKTLTASGGIVIGALPQIGELTISLTAANTTLLKDVEGATLELAITYGSDDPIKVQIPLAYTVKASDC